MAPFKNAFGINPLDAAIDEIDAQTAPQATGIRERETMPFMNAQGDRYMPTVQPQAKMEGVNPKLSSIIAEAADGFPYKVEIISGARAGDSRQHGRGGALDVVLVDPKTGKKLPNYQDASAFDAYEAFAKRARTIQEEQYPELAQSFRWGGYFGGAKGKYGAFDLMHFDVGGTDNLGMAGGSWTGGLTDEQAAIWGIKRRPGAPSPDTAAPVMAETYTKARPFQPFFEKYGSQYGVAPNVLSGVARAESDYNPMAMGPVTRFGRARGMMQFMAPTAEELKIDPFNPEQAIEGSARLLAQYISRYDGNVEHGLAAYNWGPGNVDAWRRAGADPMKLPTETRNYIAKVERFSGATATRQDRVVQAPLPDLPPDNKNVEDAFARAEKAAPGRYKLVDEGDVGAWQKQWEADNRSTGLLGDLGRRLESANANLGLSVREAVGQIPDAGPTIVKTLDSIDEWVSGTSPEERLTGIARKNEATLTPEGIAATHKDWWDEKKGTFGSAWSDPRSYLFGAVDSLPATIATMAPSMLLARAAYGTAIASGAAKKVAAASAARTATIAGGISEGLVSGGDSARSVREQILALPLDVVAQSEAAKTLMARNKTAEQARAMIAEDAATQAFITSGVLTGISGGVGDRALAKIVGEGVGGSIGRRMATGAARGAISEGGEEAAQGVGQAGAENLAVQKADPSRPLTKGMANQAIGGMVVGAGMGTGFGAVGGTSSPAQPEEAIPVEIITEPHAAGPIARAMEHGQKEMAGGNEGAAPSAVGEAAAPSGAAASVPPAAAVPDGAPPPGESVIIAAPGMKPFPARVEGYEGGEAIITTDAGEEMQVPVNLLHRPGAAAPTPPEATPKPTSPTPDEGAAPEASSPPPEEQPPAGPSPAETATAVRQLAARVAAAGHGSEDAKAVGNAYLRAQELRRLAGDIESGDTATAERGRAEIAATGAPAENAPGAGDAGKPPVGAAPPADATPPDEPPPPAAPAAPVVPGAPSAEPAPKGKRSETIAATLRELADQAEAMASNADDGAAAARESEQAKAIRNAADEIASGGDAAIDAARAQFGATWFDQAVRRRTYSPPPARPAPAPTSSVDFPDDAHSALYALGKSRYDARMSGMNAERMQKLLAQRRQAVADAIGGGITPAQVDRLADDYRRTVDDLRQETAAGARVTAPVANLSDEGAAWWASLGADARQAVLDAAEVKRGPKSSWDFLSQPIRDKLIAARAPASPTVGAPVQTETPAPIETAAHEAATSPQNALPEPTQAQKEAGNYRLGHIRLGGLDISIENPEGSERKGVDKSGKPWSVTMRSHYGYLKRTEGKDGDHVDVFVKPGTEAVADDAPVFVIDQNGENGRFDEHKVMLGWRTGAEARAAYMANYSKGWTGFSAVTKMPLAQFREWLADGDTAKPAKAPATPQKLPSEAPVAPSTEIIARIPTADGEGEWHIAKIRSGYSAVLIDKETGKAVGDRVKVHKTETAARAFVADQLAKEVRSAADAETGSPPSPDAATPPRQETAAAADADRFKENRIFTADRVEAARARLRAKMGQLNSGIDPDLLVDGMTIAGAYIEAGVRSFSDYAKAMADDLGPRIRPYLLSFWEAARAYPGLDTKGMTSPEESTRQHAVVMSDGMPAEEAPAIGQTEPKPAKRAKKTGADGDIVLTDDWGVPHIDGYDGNEDTKAAFLKEAAKYARQVARSLQEADGLVPATRRDGKPMKAVGINESGVATSGDVTMSLYAPERDASVHLTITGASLRGVVPMTKSGVAVMFRVAPGREFTATGGTNRWASTSLTAAELGETIRKALAAVKSATPTAATERDNGRLESAGAEALAGVPADGGGRDEGQRNPGRAPERSGGADASRDGGTGSGGLPAGRSVPDGAGAVPVSAGGRAEAGRGRGAVADASDGGRGEARRPDDVRLEPAAGLPAASRPVDTVLTAADEIGTGGAKTKFRANIAAITTLRAIEAEARAATADEQRTMAKWVGWGGLRAAFPREDGSVVKGWEREAAELRALLSDDEYRAAESSTRNAHYTSPEIVTGMWALARRLGFSGGRMLEPSVGIGNFLGFMPAELRPGTAITGVELDHITGGMARALYPNANIQAPVGFQQFDTPDGTFDLVIGNPPFGSEKLFDKKRPKISKFSIHNYFFAKSVDALRPGGVLAMVVTNRFMDGAYDMPRGYIAARADLIGAIRLPNDAFAKNAGTEVTTDIIVLQKRDEGAAPGGASWAKTVDFRDAEGRTVPLNEYFAARPEMMLGQFGAYGTMYGPEEPALVARPGQDTAAALRKTIEALPAGIMPAPGHTAPVEERGAAHNAAEALVGSMFLAEDGALHVRLEDELGQPRSEPVKVDGDKARDRLAGMVRIRDAFAALRRAQIDETATDGQLTALRAAMNKVYDAFVRKHGPVNADANKRLFREDPTWPQISALEDRFDKGLSAEMAKKTGETARAPSAVKAAVFTKRTQFPYRRPTTASSAKDALAATLADLGRVDIQAAAQLYGKPVSDTVSELGELVFRLPGGGYDLADAYLSGPVKTKLEQAREAAKSDAGFARNVAALEAVQPADIDAVDIDVKPGASWVPEAHVAAFIDHIGESKGSQAHYVRASATWVTVPTRASEAAEARWSTDRVDLGQIVDAALNGRTVSVYDKVGDNRVLNQSATDAANAKVTAVRQEWARWIWTDDDRRAALHRLYNDVFNTEVERHCDGAHLTLPGKISDDVIRLRPHQKNFVWRVLQSATALADHTVGAGKTFSLIAAAMELRRTAQARKPMFVVPNHLVGQWASDFIRLYPGARILAATKQDFEKERRKRLFARIATGDWDAVIVAHSSFGRIGVDPVYEQRFIKEQVADVEESIRTLRAALGKEARSVSQLTKMRDTMAAKLERLMNQDAKDVGLTFEELGIDALFVDEAHEFKNLGFATSMQRVAGLGNTLGSQKAADLYMKVSSVLDRTGGRNVVFATGTPLSNTMAEMFTLQRYLDRNGLRDLGLQHFDAWARVFGEVVTDWELSPSGQYKMNSRFAKFVNMPELMQRYRSFGDVVTNDNIQAQLAAIGQRLPLPAVKGGKPTIVIVERSAAQAAYIGVGKVNDLGETVYPQGSLVWRAENLPKRVEKGSDNMLKVMSDARKAALDMRLIDPSYSDAPGSKVHIAADHMLRLYHQWSEQRGTQLVFIDLSTPQKAKAKEAARLADLVKRADEGDESARETLDAMSPDEFMALDGKFSVYDDLRQKLIDRGIPASEIAFIHDANTEGQKEELFAKVRAGRIRFLFGSTAKMGAGTNVQNRLVALHHLDAPWRPSDLEQRDGRGIRQGNELYALDPDGFEIEILRYATKGTLDARQWQTIEAKARFVQQVRAGSAKDRVVEDIGGEAANAAEMKAAASGNPLILEEMDLRQRLRRMQSAETEHTREQHRIRERVRQLEDEAKRITKRLPAIEKDAVAAEAIGSDFAGVVGNESYETPKAFGEAMVRAGREMLTDGQDFREIGNVGGFKVGWDALPYPKGALNVTLNGAEEHTVPVDNIITVSGVGLAMRVKNTLSGLTERPALARERLAKIAADVPALQEQLKAWAGVGDLDALRQRHDEVLTALRPKQQQSGGAPATPAPSAANRYSVAPIVLRGDEVGAPFRGPEDMPRLRHAAAAWYYQNLRGTTAVMRDGTEVRFSRQGQGKSTSASKGELLLRSVPAIRRIIETGRVVFDEEGNREGVLRRRIVSAPVILDGMIHILAASVHQSLDGQYHYDFTFDRTALSASGVPGVTPGGDGQTMLPLLPSLDVPQSARSSGTLLSGKPTSKETRAANIVTELRQSREHGSVFSTLLDRGRLVVDDNVTSDAPSGVQAWTTPDGVIHLNATALAPDDAAAVVLHEAFHAGGRAIVSDAAWKRLLKRLSALVKQSDSASGRMRSFFDAARARVAAAEAAGVTMDDALRAEEFGAYAIEEYASAPPVVKSWVDAAAGTAKAWLLRRFGVHLGSVTPAQLHTLARAALRAAPVPAADGAVRYSLGSAGQWLADEFGGRWSDAQKHLLKAVPLNYFTELARPNMTAVGDYLRVKRLLDAYRGKRHAASDAIAQRWLKIGKTGKAVPVALANMMHAATLAGVDPAVTTDEEREKAGYADLRKRFTALPKNVRELYQDVRDAYREQQDELDRILIDNIRKAMEVGAAKAEREYLKELKRLQESGLKGRMLEEASLAAHERFMEATTRGRFVMRAKITRMRKAFESARVPAPYFPLGRFGERFVAVRDVDGTLLSFSRRESKAEATRLARDMRQAFPGATVTTGVMASPGDVRAAMDPRMLVEIEQILNGVDVSGDLMDQIWQRYLEAMPDLSVRKRFIHRKGTAGFSGDALRVFANHMFHAAHQMARLKYGGELQELTNVAEEQAHEADDPERAMVLANALKARHDWVMNPAGSSAAQTLTSLGFLWYLAATPAAALVNLTQTSILGIPILSARFGNPSRVGAELVGALRDFAAGRGSTAASPRLTADEKAAMEDFYESGLVDRTQSHDLAGVGDTGVTYSPVRAKVMRLVAWAFHHAERLNREVTALAAYRLARRSGMTQTAAIEAAHELTWKTHFDYANSSRPEIMQGDLAKVALQFKNYQFNMLYRLFRDIHQSMKGETPAARREARTQLVGIMGMMALHAGVKGIPFFGAAMVLLSLAFGDKDDPFSVEDRIKKALVDTIGPRWATYLWEGVPGTALGVDISGRVGMPDLLFRSPGLDLDGQDAWAYWAEQVLGPTVGGLSSTMMRGFGLVSQGKIERGIETVAPKPIRDALKTWRYAQEGVTTLRGDPIVQPAHVTGWDLAAQALGFTPARIAEAYERNNALKNAEKKVMDRRHELLNRYAAAVVLRDDGARRDVLGDIAAFNRVPVNRTVAITPETIKRSLASRAKTTAKMEDGVLIQDKELGRYLRGRMPARAYQ